MLVILPRKVAGALFCFVGFVFLADGIFGRNSSGIAGILAGALFFGAMGFLALKTSTGRPKSPLSVPVTGLRPNITSGLQTPLHNAYWTHVLPTVSGLYWYRSNWHGKQEDPELVTYELETEFFTTAGLISLFREDFVAMDAEFWTEPVTPHRPPPKGRP